MTVARSAGQLAGIWLTTDAIRIPIERLLVDMLAPNLPSPVLREAELEEFRRGVKLADVVLEYLGLRTVGVDDKGAVPLRIVAPKLTRDPWREMLLVPGGDVPIGVLLDAVDAQPVALVHEVFTRFGEHERELVRRYTALAAGGASHASIIEALRTETDVARVLASARRCVQFLDPALLFSPDGTLRVQLGSLSQTMKDIVREGHEGEQLFILPANLFEGKTNHGDIEFLVYLNFFVRQKLRTRIAGTAHQREVLRRLLTLTLFGVFDPSVAEPPPFQKLRDAFGLDSRETYEFLLSSYQSYAARRGLEPGSPLLGLDDYVDFVTLEGGPTAITLPAGEVRITPRGRMFDVRIVQRDGGATEKQLEISTPSRLFRKIPDDLRTAIQFATERPCFGVTPLGTSHGFDPEGDFTSFVIWVHGKGIHVDPSPEALAYLEQAGVAPVDVPYVFITHVHADHDGGLIEKLLGGSRATIIASDPVFRAFAEKAQLITGHDFEREGLVKHLSANPGHPVRIEIAGQFAQLETRWNLHPIPTNGLKVTFGGRTFGYSGDTQFDPPMLAELHASGRLSSARFEELMHFFWTRDGQPSVDLLYHEAGMPPIHTDKGVLSTLPKAVLDRTMLVHIADRDVPEDFPLAKPRLFGTHALLPQTPESRHRMLLETMRLVPYLYDIPSDTLATLLHGGSIVAYAPGEIVMRKGTVAKNEPFHFQIITDGQMSVRDGRRIIARLAKADTFGEWGISHQRGFRVADVVADRTSQTIRLGEEQYHWLVGKHPVVQERISKVRNLLPKLQRAQQRARMKAESERGLRSVIEHMNSSQLSSFAIFSKVKTFTQGHAIIVQGAEADGFYILLSGHLGVRLEGEVVGELSEGDVFGEMGLLQGGIREADVIVVSADAEVLFMSSRSFRTLLQAVPAFAWGIRETAAGRRESIRRRRASNPR